MAEVYVTLGEAAELERVKYNTMVKRVLRKQESFVTKTEKSENGGKDVVLVAVSSLSKQARNAWKEREKLKSFTEEFPDKKEDEQKVSNMTEEELKEFRNSLDPDSMGFFGEESV